MAFPLDRPFSFSNPKGTRTMNAILSQLSGAMPAVVAFIMAVLTAFETLATAMGWSTAAMPHTAEQTALIAKVVAAHPQANGTILAGLLGKLGTFLQTPLGQELETLLLGLLTKAPTPAPTA
jgi:hypothetical protein